MGECKWCEEEKEILHFRQYPYEEGKYCEKCIMELDYWSKQDWEKFYDELNEAMEMEPTVSIDDYLPFEEKIKRQSQDSYGVCDICGKNRNYGHCSCV